jgi:hypothetical protein
VLRDDLERVVDLVRDAGGEPPDERHLLHLAHPVGEGLPLALGAASRPTIERVTSTATSATAADAAMKSAFRRRARWWAASDESTFVSRTRSHFPPWSHAAEMRLPPAAADRGVPPATAAKRATSSAEIRSCPWRLGVCSSPPRFTMNASPPGPTLALATSPWKRAESMVARRIHSLRRSATATMMCGTFRYPVNTSLT